MWAVGVYPVRPLPVTDKLREAYWCYFLGLIFPLPLPQKFFCRHSYSYITKIEETENSTYQI